MRLPLLHRWLHAWACLAMLLVLVAPLISRAIAHQTVGSMQAPDAHAGRHLSMEPETPQPANPHHMHHDMEHGTVHAMPMMPEVADKAGLDTTSAESADPHAEHEMGVDCEYCLIAARMISLLVALLLMMTSWPEVLRALIGLVDTRRVPAPGTLGARGPPSALAC